ncbi:MAG: hypothetical protein I8H86_02465 [Sphingomonadaceae bacterium]|nr:hypothetical protein [Sphingomonadaceae bacterium]
MMKRLFPLGLAMVLAGCDGKAPAPANGQAGSPEQASSDDGKADCAIGAGAEWAHDCPVERAGKMLTIRHPDGGFRRFRVLDDGRGLETADGAEQAKLQIVDTGRIEMRVGGDRYRLPVQIASAGGR